MAAPGIAEAQASRSCARSSTPPPAVAGTSTPPQGASGAIRRYAFRRSESDWWHWLPLQGADRIGVVEGIVADLGRGKVPTFPTK